MNIWKSSTNIQGMSANIKKKQSFTVLEISLYWPNFSNAEMQEMQTHLELVFKHPRNV